MRGSQIAFALGIVSLAGMSTSGPPLLAGPDPVLTISGAGPAPPYEVSVTLTHEQAANGWAIALCHDPLGLAVESVGLGAVGQTVNGGAPPDWFDIQITPDSWVLGVIVSLQGQHMLPAGTDLEIAEALYTPVSAGTWTACTCTSGGPPPTATIIVYSGASIAPPPACGTLEVDPALVHEFVRGDANLDGAIDIADPVAILDHLFLGGASPPCFAAGDIDADGSEDIGDVIRLLAHLFSGGPDPVPPFPACGVDPGASCGESACP